VTAIYKTLKRKDAASVIVAVVVALIISQLLPALTADLTGWLVGTPDKVVLYGEEFAATWQAKYLTPLVSAALQLLALEILIRLYGLVRLLTAKTK
jgi:hypothetical protein